MRLLSIIFVSMLLFLTGCQKNEEKNNEEKHKEIRVGVIAGPEAELMRTVQKTLKEKYGLDIKIIEFHDYNMPNVALNDQSIDANAFQHQPFLEQIILKSSFDLVPLGRTFIYPMAVYSKKYTRIQDIPNGAVIAIPNDPTNQARALLLLEKAGIITLQRNVKIFATPMDITQNPKNVIIKPMDAALISGVFDNVDLAAINTNFALRMHLLAQRDGLVTEGPESFYANIIAVRAEDKRNPDLEKLVRAFQSPEVIAIAEKLFQGQAIPAWVTPR